MKNIQPVLFFFELINQWNYHTYISLFDMKESKRYEKMFHKAYYGISHPLSKYEMYITTSLKTESIGFMMEDKTTKQPVLFADLQNYGRTCIMWPDWMYLPMNSSKIVFNDRHPSTEDLEVTLMTEEEHFQTMMLRDLPPFNVIAPSLKVYEYLKPIANEHRIGFSIDYNNLDIDFKTFIPSEYAFDQIDSLFGNALELCFEAETHGKPFNYFVIS